MRRLAVVFICLVMLGCATAGSGKIQWDKARQLKVGMTESQVTQIMGGPYSVAAKDDGTEMWVWVHVNLYAGSESLSLTMKDGKVNKVPKIPESFN